MPPRRVSVDMGHGLAENWVEARVVQSRACATLFDGPGTELLAELPGGERVWVSSRKSLS